MIHRLSILAGTSILAAGAILTASPAQAGTLSFTIDEFTGSNAQVELTLTDIATDTVQVVAEVLNPPSIGDIVGIFFNLDSSIAIPSLSISNPSGTDPLTVGTSPRINTLFLDKSGSTRDRITDVNNNANLNGGGVIRIFDAAVQVGVGGLRGGRDDYQKVSFDLSATGLDIGDFDKLGVRLQSVGTTNRNGSSKLEGDVPTGAIPEPLTMLGVGAAASFGAFFKKRLAKGNRRNA